MFLVQSEQEPGSYYRVDFTGAKSSKAICEHPACKRKKDICSHILIVMLHQNFDVKDYFEGIFESDPPQRKQEKKKTSLTKKVRENVTKEKKQSMGKMFAFFSYRLVRK